MQPRVKEDMKEVLFGFVRKKKGIELECITVWERKLMLPKKELKVEKSGGGVRKGVRMGMTQLVESFSQGPIHKTSSPFYNPEAKETNVL